MRDELRKILDADRRYSLADLDHVYNVAMRLHSESINSSNRQYGELEKQNPDLVDDIMDDLVWYRHLEDFMIWHFALCRIQAVLEGYIVKNFLSDSSKKGGLKSKLNELKKISYVIANDDYSQLIEWTQLRNALSHFPPGKHAYGELNQSDISEYLELCKRVLLDVEKQKTMINSHHSK